jgi:poly(3-hydroxybutyrate) depolymerase
MKINLLKAIQHVIRITISAFWVVLFSLLYSTTLYAQVEDIQVGTLTRKMLVYAPLNIQPNRPLVLSLHGMNQDIAYQQNQTKWEEIAKANNFVVVYPAGINNSWSLSGTRDTDFILAIIDEMHKRYDIDRNRVYLSGFSMGGMMTYYAATRIADKIAAFAPVAGYLMGGPNTSSSRAIPIIHTHGTTDDVVPFSGVQTSLDAWIKRNNCPTTPVVVKPYPKDKLKSNAELYTWGPGTDSVEVVLLKINNVGHWHSINPEGVNTSQEIWNFCKKYTLAFGIPEFHSAFVNDDNPNQISVTFNKPIENKGSFTGFSVKIDGQPATIENIIHSGPDQLQINIGSDILADNEVVLSYSNGNVISIYKKNLIPFSEKIVDNLLFGAPPRLVELVTTVNGDSLIARFNKKMLLPSDISTISLNAHYNEVVNIPILQFSFLNMDSTEFVFKLGERVYADYNLLFSYSSNNIASVDNALLKAISDFQVTNNSLGLPVYVQSCSLAENSYEIIMTFSKPIILNENQLNQFSFEVNGNIVHIQDFIIRQNTVRFILAKNLHYGDIIGVSYNPGDIIAPDKGDLLAISNLSIENPLDSPTWYSLPGRIEAENFTFQMGTVTKTTTDEGGGFNIGETDKGDWLEYAIENNSEETEFNIRFRLAAQSTGGRIEVVLNDNKALAFFVPNSGGDQIWRSVDRKISIDKGRHYMKVLVAVGGFGLNYIEIHSLSTGIDEIMVENFNAYPNPATNHLAINSADFIFNKVEIIDMMGNIVMSRVIPNTSGFSLPLSLPGGIYALKISNASDFKMRKIVVRNE